MKIHFTVKYNMTYYSKASCYCEFTGTGCLEISEDEIYNSSFKTAKEWLDYFIEFDEFFNQIDYDDICWNSRELKVLEEAFKHNQINSNNFNN